MKKLMSLMVSTVAALSMTACGQQVMSPIAPMMAQPQVRVQNTNSEILVRFKAQISSAHMNEFSAKYGLRVLRVLPQINTYVMQADTVGLSSQQILKYLNQDPVVMYAESNGTMKTSPVPEMQITPIFN